MKYEVKKTNEINQVSEAANQSRPVYESFLMKPHSLWNPRSLSPYRYYNLKKNESQLFIKINNSRS